MRWKVLLGFLCLSNSLTYGQTPCNTLVNAGNDFIICDTSATTLMASNPGNSFIGKWKHIEGAPSKFWPEEHIIPFTSSASIPQAVPDYLVNVKDGRWPQTNIKRISDQSVITPNTAGVWNNFGPWYANRQHWNADNSLMLLQVMSHQPNGNYNGAVGAPSNFVLLNGETGAYIKPAYSANGLLPQMFRWSNTDPDLVYYINGTAPILRSWRPSTDNYGIAKDFSGQYDAMSATFGGGVNDPSISGQYWALAMRNGSQWYITVWDAVNDVIVSNIPIPWEPSSPGSPLVDHDMSRSGEYVIIACDADWWSGSTYIAKGIAVFNRQGNYLHSININAPIVNPIVSVHSHHTIVLTENNEDRYVAYYSEDGIERWLVSYNLADGTRRDESPKGIFFGAYYISSSSFNKPDLALVSDFPVTAYNYAFNALPLQRHISYVKIDGSKKLYPVAQELISLVDFSSADQYYLYPWATSNRDGSKVLFKSAFNTDWSSGLPNVFHAYLASPRVKFQDSSNTTTVVSNLGLGDHKFVWTVSDGTCVSTDTVKVSVLDAVNCIALPVNDWKLSYIDIGNCKAQLHWQAKTNTAIHHFEIEHSLDARNYANTATISSKPSNDLIEKYQFEFENLNIGINFYRLKIVFKDGVSMYTDPIKVNNKCKFDRQFSIYPQPIKKGSTSSIEADVKEELKNAKMKIYASNGVLISTSELHFKKGKSIKTLNNLSDLNAGAYIINIIDKNEQLIYSSKLTVIN